MITKIRLKNWKSHLDSEFEFSSGVNAIMGIMGSGKSSVLQAISFALFGTFPSHQTRKVSLDDLIMIKPQKQKRAEIELEFRVGEDDYYIRRTLEYAKGTTHAEIRKNNKMVEVNPAGVTKEVERALGIDYELFSKAVYSEQDGIDYFLRIPRGQRMAQIDRMVKLDRFGKVRERAVALKNRIIERRKEKLKFVAEMEKEEFASRIRDIEDELKDFEEQSASLKESREKVSTEKKKYEESVSLIEDKETELNELKIEMGSAGASIREVEKQIKEKKSRIKDKSVSDLQKSMEVIKRGISELEERAEEKNESERGFRDKISETNTKIMILTKEEIPRLEATVAEMEGGWERFRSLAKKYGSEPDKELAERNRELESQRKHLYNVEAQKKELLNSLEQLRGAVVKCPVCDSDLEENRKKELISQRVRKAEELDRKIADSREKASKMEASVQEIEHIAKEITILKERLKDYDSRKKELDDTHKSVENMRKGVNKAAGLFGEMKTEMEKVRKELDVKRGEYGKLQLILNDMKDMSLLQSRLNEYLEKRKVLEKEIKSREESLEKFNLKELRSKLQSLVAEESEANAKLASIEDKIMDRQKNIEELKKRREILEKHKKESLRDEMMTMQLETFVKVLRLTQEQLRTEFLQSVNMIMNRIWDELYPYGDFSEIRLMVEEGDYVLKLRSSEGWIPVEGVASGGERSMSVLALRIAFSMAFIPNLRWLILDEPTHNLDTNAIGHLSDVLREKMDKFAEQVFLITHEEGIANGITGQLYRLERNKASNEATRIRS